MTRNESFSFQVSQDSKTMNVSVFDHKTFGKDKLVGEANVDVSAIAMKCFVSYGRRYGDTLHQDRVCLVRK